MQHVAGKDCLAVTTNTDHYCTPELADTLAEVLGECAVEIANYAGPGNPVAMRARVLQQALEMFAAGPREGCDGN